MSAELFWAVTVTAGNALPYDLSADLDSLTLEEERGRSDKLILQISDPYKVLGHALQEGMDVEVDLGTSEDHSVVFRGQIHKVEATFPSNDTPRLTVNAYDRSQMMGLRPRNLVHKDMQLAEIVRQVAQPYFGDRIRVEAAGNPKFDGNGLRQTEKTDREFLLDLAEQYGCEFYVEPGETEDQLCFVAQSKIMQAGPIATLTYGRTDVENVLLEFRAETDPARIKLPERLCSIDSENAETAESVIPPAADQEQPEDECRDENLEAFRTDFLARAATLESLLGQAPAAQEVWRQNLGNSVRGETGGFSNADHQKARADNQHPISQQGMAGSGKTSGCNVLHAQSCVCLADVGARFSGHWFLTRVVHRLDENGYVTEFDCQR